MNEPATPPLVGLPELSARSGLSIDAIRCRLRADPGLRARLAKVGRVYVIESARLDEIAGELRRSPARNFGK